MSAVHAGRRGLSSFRNVARTYKVVSTELFLPTFGLRVSGVLCQGKVLFNGEVGVPISYSRTGQKFHFVITNVPNSDFLISTAIKGLLFS